MNNTFEQLVEHLLEHSIRTGDFTLRSGRKSTWFCDAKQTACRPEGILLIANAALEIIPDDVYAIGGLTAGADPVAFGILFAVPLVDLKEEICVLLVFEKNLKIME